MEMEMKKKRCYARPRTRTLGLTEDQPLLNGSPISHGAQGAGIVCFRVQLVQ